MHLSQSLCQVRWVDCVHCKYDMAFDDRMWNIGIITKSVPCGGGGEGGGGGGGQNVTYSLASTESLLWAMHLFKWPHRNLIILVKLRK